MRIAIVSGAYPPDLDGIGDYTWNLARELAKAHQILVATSRGSAPGNSESVEVIQIFDPKHPLHYRNSVAAVRVWHPDWIVVQYNPFSYGRCGFCPWLPLTLHKNCKGKSPPHLAVMFHETYVPANHWKFMLMRFWQIPQFAAMCRLADAVFVSTIRWLPKIRRFRKNPDAAVLPVGSNIPRSVMARVQSREILHLPPDATILGVFGSAHPSRLTDWIGAAAQKVHDSNPKAILLYVGKDGSELRTRNGSIPMVDLGVLPAHRVADAIRAMDVMLCPFSDGISARRGSALAALQNDIPIVSTIKAWSDEIFRENMEQSVYVSKVEDGREYYVQTLSNLIKSGRLERSIASTEAMKWYESHFGWCQLADRLVMRLKLQSC